MDLEFQTQTVQIYDVGEQQVLSQEETLETIVPDYCPDIARIIQTEGTVLIHTTTPTATGVQVNGTVRVQTLYVPDGTGGLRSVEYSIPFALSSDAIGSCAHVGVETELEMLECRTLNPRKLFTHCKLVTRLSAYRTKAHTISADVISPEGCSIEKRYSQQRAVCLSKIVGKDCTFSQPINLSPAKGGATELLLSRVAPQVSETKLMGNKLIFKGIFHVSMLYATGTGTHCLATESVPFSHIMDVGDQPEQAVGMVQLQLTGWDLQLDSGDDEGRTLSLSVYAHAIAMVREQQQWTLLDDVYATAYDINFNRTTLAVEAVWDVLRRRQTVREVLEIGVVPQAVIAATVACSPVQLVREGQMVSLRTAAMVKVLYTDEAGSPLLVQRTMDITSQLELPPTYTLSAQAHCFEEVQSVLGERGIEVRFCVEFAGEMKSSDQCSCIASAQVDLTAPKDLSKEPSLVLRRMDGTMTPWTLAKTHHTTIAAILTANHLATEEDLPKGELLLIPKKRG